MQKCSLQHQVVVLLRCLSFECHDHHSEHALLVVFNFKFSIFNLLGFNIIGITFCACLGLGSFVGRSDNHPSLCQPHGSEYTTGLEEARLVLCLTQKESKWVGETDLVHVSIIKIFHFVGQNVFN